jgi:hypothetical protein
MTSLIAPQVTAPRSPEHDAAGHRIRLSEDVPEIGSSPHLHIGFKGTMNALFLKDRETPTPGAGCSSARSVT